MQYQQRRKSTRLSDSEYIYLLEEKIRDLKAELQKEKQENARFLNEMLESQQDTIGKAFSAMLNAV